MSQDRTGAPSKSYAGLDVSLRTTAICIVDDTGRIAFEGMWDSRARQRSRRSRPSRRRQWRHSPMTKGMVRLRPSRKRDRTARTVTFNASWW